MLGLSWSSALCGIAALAWFAWFALIAHRTPADAQPRTPIVASLELAILQPPVVVPIDGVRHLAYELHMTNLRPTDVEVARIEVLDGDHPPVAIADVRDAALADALGHPGLAKPPADKRRIAAGRRAVF